MTTYAAVICHADKGWLHEWGPRHRMACSREGSVADSITLSNAKCKCKREAEIQDAHELHMNKALDAMQPCAVASVEMQGNLVRR